MLSKKKKVFILVGMVALLVLTGCLNIFLNKDTNVNGGSGGNVTYDNIFAMHRADRIATREQTVLYLDAIINNTASSEASKLEAETSKLTLTKNMELELVLEGLITALGYPDAFVTNSTENINVIVKQEVLTEVEANRILDVVVRETQKDATNVIIIPVK